jgi:hypothetical protein
MKVHLLVLLAAISAGPQQAANAHQPPRVGLFRKLLENEYKSQCNSLVDANWASLQATMSENFVIAREKGTTITRDAYIAILKKAYVGGLRFLNCRTSLGNITWSGGAIRVFVAGSLNGITITGVRRVRAVTISYSVDRWCINRGRLVEVSSKALYSTTKASFI